MRLWVLLFSSYPLSAPSFSFNIFQNHKYDIKATITNIQIQINSHYHHKPPKYLGSRIGSKNQKDFIKDPFLRSTIKLLQKLNRYVTKERKSYKKKLTSFTTK